jgi:branched-subunit amino acid aminotransferase/4-amino-4-deoxychorismate lyase
MSQSSRPIIHLDGKLPTVSDLEHPALVNYGHFTAMQIRGGRVRGLNNHLTRLREAHAELFGTHLDVDRVRGLMRQAVRLQPNSYLRVTVFEVEPGSPRVMTVLRPPIDVGRTSQSLLPVAYSRPLAHIKHVGTFAQIRFRVIAERQGFDDALFLTADGRIAETTIANIGFIDGSGVIWPDAPALHGVTWQILDDCLAAEGITSRQASVTIETAEKFNGAFVANSIGITPVGMLGDHEYRDGQELMTRIIDSYSAAPWDDV